MRVLVAKGAAIRTRRQACAYSQREVAEWVGCSKQAVMLWEHGKRRIRVSHLAKLAEVLECGMNDLAQYNVLVPPFPIEEPFVTIPPQPARRDEPQIVYKQVLLEELDTKLLLSVLTSRGVFYATHHGVHLQKDSEYFVTDLLGYKTPAYTFLKDKWKRGR